MRYEWKKLLASPYACLLLVAILVINGVLFHGRCTDSSAGFSQVDVRHKFSQQIDLTVELSTLEQRGWEGQNIEDTSLITGNVYTEQQLDQEVLRQIQLVEGYPDTLRQWQREIQARLHAGLAGSEDSYVYRGQLAVLEAYHRLEGLQPPVSFSGGITSFCAWYLTDLLLLLWGGLGALILLTQERTSGMLLLLRSTQHGRVRLFVQKFAVLLLFATIGFVLLYGTNALLSASLLGWGNLSRPLQSIPDFIACPVPLTIAGYLLLFLLQKLLWLWTVCAVMGATAVVVHTGGGTVMLWSGLAAISLGLNTSRHQWLQSLSLMTQCMVQDRYQDALMMNLLGIPVASRLVFPFMCLLLLLVSTAGATLYAQRCSSVTGSRTRLWPTLRPGRHVSLLQHEAYKLFITRGGAALAVLFLLMQLGVYLAPRIHANGSYERDLRHYSDILEGAPSAEKESFLRDETYRFNSIRAQLTQYEAHTHDPALLDLLTADLRQALRPQEAFEDAKSQYEGLAPGQYYVHPSGWQRLFNQDGQRDFLLNLILLGVFLTVSLGGVFSIEEETGVAVLQTTAGVRKAVRRRKLVLSAGLSLLLAILAFAPEYVAVAYVFGLHQGMAPAASLPFFQMAPAAMRLWHVLAVSIALQLVWSITSMFVVLGLSSKTKNTIITLLLSLAILLLPPLVLLFM